jgi:hypothetical protein
MIAEVEVSPTTAWDEWSSPEKTTSGTVKIFPVLTPGGYTFALDGSGPGWSVSESEGEWLVNLAGGHVLYQMTFELSAMTGFTFSPVAAELSQKAVPGAYVVQGVPPGSVSILLSFVNSVQPAEQAVRYSLGFSFQAPGGQTVIWDPTIVLNPPG